jgi:hypothetical protein
MSENLKYLGTGQGKVIKAIAVDRINTFREIMNCTGFNPLALRRILAELHTDKAISLENSQYQVVDLELENAYLKYYKKTDNNELKENNIKEPKEQPSNLIGKINAWKGLHCPNITLDSDHFYLDDLFIDDFSNFIVQNSQKQIIIVNPFVEKCHLSDALIQASQNGKDVTLITQPPDRAHREYNNTIKNGGVKMFYNEGVHAKMLVVDRAVAIVSSMNLTRSSTGGRMWESGIISVKGNVVESIMDSIQNLIRKPESKPI